MSADELRRHITAVPFRPFTINVADGRRIPVIARDFILMSPSGRVIYVVQRDDSTDYIDYLLITGLCFDPPAPVSAQPTTNASNP